jgi:hypothetical protein
MNKQVFFIRYFLLCLFITEAINVQAQHPTRNPKFHKSIIKSFCENCTLPVDYENGLVEYTEEVSNTSSHLQLQKNLLALAGILSGGDDKRVLKTDTASGTLRTTGTVDLYGGSTFNGIKKLGVCQYQCEIQLTPKGYRYRINNFMMQGSNRKLHAYLEALHSNVRLHTQATFCVIEAIEGVYNEDKTYVPGVIDKIVIGMKAD